jgi:hypothetical protein
MAARGVGLVEGQWIVDSGSDIQVVDAKSDSDVEQVDFLEASNLYSRIIIIHIILTSSP